MNKLELWVFGLISIIALLLLLIVGNRAITGSLIEESYEVFEIGTEILKHAPTHYPRFSYVPLGAVRYEQGELPLREALTPDWVEFEVNRIPIFMPNVYHFIPLKKDRIHTYAGRAGYFAQDPRKFIDAYLCSYAYKFLGAPLRCEPVLLGYDDGVLTFFRGYGPDEYIGYQAVSTDFAALFILTNPEYGILAASPVAYLKFTD